MKELFNIRQSLSIYLDLILYFLVFILTFKIITLQFVFGPDYKIHLDIIEKYVNGSFHIPHPGFHISAYYLSHWLSIPLISFIPIYISSIFVLTVILSKKLLIFLSPGLKHSYLYTIFAILINIVIAIYFPYFNPNKYLGQWSPNIWHSPTMTLLKPFAMLGTIGISLLLMDKKNYSINSFVLISFYLLLGTYIKPSFIICLIPAVFIYLIIFHSKNFHFYLKVFYIISPSILLLIFQFLATYTLKDTESYFHDSIKITWFGVFKLYSNNIAISTLLVLAFPLSVLLVLRKKIMDNKILVFSWILCIISLLQAGLLAEKEKFGQGAFIFGYIICLFILFIVSFCEYLNMIMYKKTSVKNLIGIGVIFLLHSISGILYMNDLLKSGPI